MQNTRAKLRPAEVVFTGDVKKVFSADADKKWCVEIELNGGPIMRLYDLKTNYPTQPPLGYQQITLNTRSTMSDMRKMSQFTLGSFIESTESEYLNSSNLFYFRGRLQSQEKRNEKQPFRAFPFITNEGGLLFLMTTDESLYTRMNTGVEYNIKTKLTYDKLYTEDGTSRRSQWYFELLEVLGVEDKQPAAPTTTPEETPQEAPAAAPVEVVEQPQPQTQQDVFLNHDDVITYENGGTWTEEDGQEWFNQVMNSGMVKNNGEDSVFTTKRTTTANTKTVKALVDEQDKEEAPAATPAAPVTPAQPKQEPVKVVETTTPAPAAPKEVKPQPVEVKQQPVTPVTPVKQSEPIKVKDQQTNVDKLSNMTEFLKEYNKLQPNDPMRTVMLNFIQKL